MRNNILLLACLLLQLTTWGQIVINEYSASNYNSSTDNNGEYEDWMELYNQGGVAIDLNGYYLSDKAGNLTKFQINNSINIAGGDYLMVYASGSGAVNANNIHTARDKILHNISSRSSYFNDDIHREEDTKH